MELVGTCFCNYSLVCKNVDFSSKRVSSAVWLHVASCLMRQQSHILCLKGKKCYGMFRNEFNIQI